MIRSRSVTIPKFGESVNEDAVVARENVIAVSDGAGGGGVYAERWSRYLLEHLPDEPIGSFAELDAWVEQIWEPFYNEHEKMAKRQGGMFLSKFYDEGSFATLVAAWRVSESECKWMSYGDSVAFCYDMATGELQHSFTRLADFNKPPYLISCKDPLNAEGFRCGCFKVSPQSVVFAASDTLAHYIIMMHRVANRDVYGDEVSEAVNMQTKDSNFIKAAMALKRINFQRDVVEKLVGCAQNEANFKRFIEAKVRKGLMGYDDYSLAVMGNNGNPSHFGLKQ